ncbi:ABC transporter permease [Martelella alba]|uniref:ABC transporter permease n=1 Tax=Martelella alba TaxID=2590451 RepID=A0ABY2SPL8_9HYPH|nr:ABC transporter permease [Martelella alba]TKI07183.1 ABC transporter permease [Martelella alba]
MKKNRRFRLSNRKRGYLLSTMTVVFFLALWIACSALGLTNPMLLPGPMAVFKAFITVATTGYQGHTLLVHVATSLYRIITAFVAACAVGIPLGILMGTSERANALLRPLIEFYRPLPPLGLYTLLVMWLGIGERSKFALLFLAALPGLIIATKQAVKNIDPLYVRAARSLGASHRQIVLTVYLPAAGPTILAGMRISLGFTYTVLVAAEIVAASAGIGWMIWDAAKFLLSDVVIMGLIVLGLTGILLDLVMQFIGRLLMPWTRH